MGAPPLAGLTIGVTADRRAEEQAELLRRRGARVVMGPMVRTELLGADLVIPATRRAMAHHPEVVVLTTSLGVRSWIDAAESAGLAEDLIEVLAAADLVVARGPKALGAAATLGLDVHWDAPNARSSQIFEHLRDRVDGRRVVVQRDGDGVAHLANQLSEAGADVVDMPVYRWTLPTDLDPARRLIRQVIDGSVDVLTFTSAAAVANLIVLAEADETTDDLRRATRRIGLVAVGEVTAESVSRSGLGEAVAPARPRLGAMTHLVAALAQGRPFMAVGNVTVRVGGTAALVGEEVCDLAPRELAVLAELARRSGAVMAKAELRRLVWADATDVDDHAIEVTIGRLRRRLPAVLEIQTVAKRGYRLLERAVAGSA
ncbi:MAG: uroporphyrinogen-III synthase [Aquihabitans sp.]